MQGQCQICKGMFEIQPEWIGQQAECPHCKQTIVVQAAQSQIPQMNAQLNSNVQQDYIGQPITNQDQTMSSSTHSANKSMGALVCGIISLIMWRIPAIGVSIIYGFDMEHLIIWGIPISIMFPLFVGLLFSIVGLILGYKNKYKGGITLNIIALTLIIIDTTDLVLGSSIFEKDYYKLNIREDFEGLY